MKTKLTKSELDEILNNPQIKDNSFKFKERLFYNRNANDRN